MNINSINELDNITGKTVLVRAGFNVSLTVDGQIEDSFRIDRAIPTLEFLQQKGAKIIVIAHIGREKTETLEPVFGYLKERLQNVSFDAGTFSKLDEQNLAEFETRYGSVVSDISNGEILLLDNLRQSSLEKNNSGELAKILAANVDGYVLEAISVAHRKHMSVDSLPRAFAHAEKYVGFNFEKEINYFEKARQPESPSLFVISGNKIDTKLPLIKNFLDSYDQILVGGVIANTLYKISGYSVGNSVIDNEITESEMNDLHSIISNKKLVLPKLVEVENSAGERTIKKIDEILEDEIIFDVIIENDNSIVYSNVASVLWNGPLGYYEKGYDKSTNYLAKKLSENDSESIVGGGNTVSAIRNAGYENGISFLSTAGGAMLDYLADGNLPAIEALKA